MKHGKDLPTLAAELQRRAKAKQDLVADTRNIGISDNGRQLVINQGTRISCYDLTALAHRQIGEHVGIPSKYYERMLADAPGLLQINVNDWFAREPARRMVRTLDGNARAFLSDKFRRLDNEDVADAALNALLARNLAQVESCEVTDTRLYIKALFPRVEAEVKAGDVIQAGVVISNSEVGLGALSVRLLMYRLVCLNGMIRDTVSRQSHVGRQVMADETGVVYREETVAADDKALMLKLEDTIASVAGTPFQRAIESMRVAAGSEPIAKPVQAVEILARTIGLTIGQKDSVLERLIKGGDYTKYGVANAITNLANDEGDYDVATQLEELGGRMIDLPANDWRQIAAAA